MGIIVNPILAPYTTPYGAYPFDKVQHAADYLPAFAEAIEEKKREIQAIEQDSEPATFENTILALEVAGRKLERVCGIFFNLLHTNSDDELMSISDKVVPQLSELSTSILLSEALFLRVKEVWDKREQLQLDEEEMRLLKSCYEGFAENGALLSPEGKDQLRDLSQRLSIAGLNFGQNILKDQKRFKLYVSDADVVQGLPDTLLSLARETAERDGNSSGWTFDLTAPSYFPFMQYCKDGSLRRQMYMAKMQVGAAGDEYDNTEIIRTLVNGRLEEANLLGFETFAHLAQHKRMAKNPTAVYQLLDELLEAYKPVAQKEILDIEHFASTQGASLPLHPWDWSYWAEQYKQTHYELDDELLRPYFELGRVTEAILGLATKLYGVTFEERYDIPVYHCDVKTFEVRDQDGSYLGLLYTDFFPREGKQSGAWMNNLQEQYIDEQGQDHRPHIVLVMNFTPPTKGRPALLTLGEVNTFLHEFGHALHGMFSRCRFSSLSGTGVARDFVELPSQIMENWLSEPEWLKTFAIHYESGESLPQSLIDRMQEARHFLAGYSCVRQLSFAYLDMAWHSLREPLAESIDIQDFEYHASEKAIVLPTPPRGAVMSTSFSHIFSGGYSAGYYSYKWAEVLDADAFSVFRQEGIFNRRVAQRFRDSILSQGDKRDAMDLYLDFRGQAPSIQALLERDGLGSHR